MPTNLISKDKIRQLADKAAGLQKPGGNPRLKTVMARLLNDLFVAIDELDISMDEVWAAVGLPHQGCAGIRAGRTRHRPGTLSGYAPRRSRASGGPQRRHAARHRRPALRGRRAGQQI